MVNPVKSALSFEAMHMIVVERILGVLSLLGEGIVFSIMRYPSALCSFCLKDNIYGKQYRVYHRYCEIILNLSLRRFNAKRLTQGAHPQLGVLQLHFQVQYLDLLKPQLLHTL